MQPKSRKSTVDIKDVNTLMDLGLPRKQARLYLALLNTGYAEAKAIAQEKNRP